MEDEPPPEIKASNVPQLLKLSELSSKYKCLSGQKYHHFQAMIQYL